MNRIGFRSGLLGVGLGLMTAACNTMSDKPKDGFLVEGQVEKPRKGRFIALYKVTPEAEALVDSVQVDEQGKFKFIGKVNQLQMFMLKVYGQQAEFFVAGNEDVNVDVTGEVPNAIIDVKAGEEEAKLKPVLKLFRQQQAELAPMNYEYYLAAQNRDMERAERYRGMMERAMAHFNGQYKHLIDSLGPSFGAYTAATRLDPNQELPFLDSVNTKLAVKYPDQPWAKQFAKLVANAKGSAEADKALAAGNAAPDFRLPTPDGKKDLGPSSFRGKYLVLDFWASWCKPCRMNSPQMVALYKKYHAKGVEILGVSLDEQADRWREAIADDKYTWPQVSDLKYWSSPLVQQYRVEGIPHLVLLDQEGKIVARGLQPAEMDQMLAGLTGGKAAM